MRLNRLVFLLALLFPAVACAQTEPGNVPANTIVGNNGGGLTALTTLQTNALLTPALNVKDYGAKGDCSTDDTAAIQAAINALPASGGTVLFPAVTTCYSITSTITVGNGTSSSPSTTNGVVLKGVGGIGVLGWNGYSFQGTSVLRWNGPNGGTMVSFVGPIDGWGVENIAFDGANGANNPNIGLQVRSARWGHTNNLYFTGCKTDGLLSLTWDPFTVLGNVDSIHNTSINTSFIVPNVAQARAIRLDGGLTGAGAVTSDTDFWTFINTLIILPNAATPTYGIYLRVDDGNIFIDTHIVNLGSGGTGIQNDYTYNSVFPSNNFFYMMDNGGTNQFANTGSPSGIQNQHQVFGLSNANGGIPPTVAGMSTIDARQLGYNKGVGGTVVQTGSISGAVTLNNITGQVTTVSNAWTTNTGGAFKVINNLANTNDTISCSVQNAVNVYQCWGWAMSTGSFGIAVLAFSSQTEAVTVNFDLFKGSGN